MKNQSINCYVEAIILDPIFNYILNGEDSSFDINL